MNTCSSYEDYTESVIRVQFNVWNRILFLPIYIVVTYSCQPARGPAVSVTSKIES